MVLKKLKKPLTITIITYRDKRGHVRASLMALHFHRHGLLFKAVMRPVTGIVGSRNQGTNPSSRFDSGISGRHDGLGVNLLGVGLMSPQITVPEPKIHDCVVWCGVVR